MWQIKNVVADGRRRRWSSSSTYWIALPTSDLLSGSSKKKKFCGCPIVIFLIYRWEYNTTTEKLLLC